MKSFESLAKSVCFLWECLYYSQNNCIAFQSETFFIYLQPAEAYSFITLLIQCYNVVCRPSNHTVGGPGPRFEPKTGDLEAGTLTTRPPPHLLYLLHSLAGVLTGNYAGLVTPAASGSATSGTRRAAAATISGCA